MSAVTFERVSKLFDDVRAVDDFSLEIVDGEFLVLLGPSGCGKTTALRLIAGLDDATEGTLRIGERTVNYVEAKDRNISMVFQSYALYPHMTVRRNIESPLLTRAFDVEESSGAIQRRKLTSDERSTRVAEAAETLGLADLMDRKPGALSGGQRQRVALARAIVARPEAFLFDEPLSNLDAKLRTATRVELVELHRRLQGTFVYVTHDQVEAMTMADRIAVMHEGRLQQVGPPQDVYDRPANLFVARFIGNPPMNTLDAQVSTTSPTGPIARVGDESILLPSRYSGVADQREVVLAVRPEHLVVGHEGFAATVRAVEWLGHERHLVCDVSGTSVIVREPSDGPAPEPGTPIRVEVVPEHIHLFDPASEERIA